MRYLLFLLLMITLSGIAMADAFIAPCPCGCPEVPDLDAAYPEVLPVDEAPAELPTSAYDEQGINQIIEDLGQ